MFGLDKKKEDKEEAPAVKTEVKATDGSGASVDESKDQVDVVLDSQRLKEQEEQKQPEINAVSWREMKALKRAKYDKVAPKCDKSYILLNKKFGMMIEIRGFSSVHACNMVGWKPRHVKIVEEKDVEPEGTPETTAHEETAHEETKRELPPGLQ